MDEKLLRMNTEERVARVDEYGRANASHVRADLANKKAKKQTMVLWI